MKKVQQEYIIRDLLASEFIVEKKQEIVLTEDEESGRSELKVWLTSSHNLCIANVDKKNTDFQFFQTGKAKSLYKRVDHIIFEQGTDNKWKLHLIEMKSSVGAKKWDEIKGKFRASYLFSKAVAGMLELEIVETVMYTTFEKIQFVPSDTIPAARRVRSGERLIRMEDEWNGQDFGLHFGERISFMHQPIRMVRDERGVLSGSLREIIVPSNTQK